MRLEERDGLLWRVELEVPADTPDAVVEPIVARVFDDWLGRPPARTPRIILAPYRDPDGLWVCP